MLIECEAQVSLTQLCAIVEMSKPTLIKYIEELEGAELISVERGDFDPETGKTPMNTYFINAFPDKAFEGRSKKILPGLRGEVKKFDSTTTTSEVLETSLQNSNPTAQLFTDYQNHFGTISSVIVDDIKADIKEYTVEACRDAFREAIEVKGHGFGWRYVQSILKRWKAEGRNTPKPAGKTIPFNSSYGGQYKTRTGDLSPYFPDGTPRVDSEGRTPDDPLFGLTIYR